MRFEIFARDGFKCRYCGRDSSEVQLVLDHMTPVCQGGETTPENLITSCFDCNAGKAGKLIEQHVPTEEDRLRREQEFREQERLLEGARRAGAARIELRQTMVNYIAEAAGIDQVDTKTADCMNRYLSLYGDVVFEWIDKAATVVGGRRFGEDLGRYVSGIRRRIVEENGLGVA